VALHHHVAASTPHLDVPVLSEDSADLTPREAPEPTQR